MFSFSASCLSFWWRVLLLFGTVPTDHIINYVSNSVLFIVIQDDEEEEQDVPAKDEL